MKKTLEKQDIDLVIVGAGPAGYSASIYASRYDIKNIVIGELAGGLISEAHRVCNYPGFEDISGFELSSKFKSQAENLGAKTIIDRILSIKRLKDNSGYNFEIITRGSRVYHSKAIILAIGTERRKLGLPEEPKFLGKGVSYCATCDGNFYKDKIVGVIGGSDSATTAALMLSSVAKKVYLIYRGNALKGEQSWISQVNKNTKIEVLLDINVKKLIGEEKLELVELDKSYNESKNLALDGIFIEIGSIPNTELSKKIGLKLDEDGYIKVSKTQETSIKGIYAAGDITTGSDGFRQVVTAASEGAVASRNVYSYINSK